VIPLAIVFGHANPGTALHALVDCTITFNLIQLRIECTAPYFLYEDNAGKVLEGRFSPGRYAIEVIVNGKHNNFTIGNLAFERSIFDTFVGFSQYYFCARLVLLEAVGIHWSLLEKNICMFFLGYPLVRIHGH
jgi:hypothetical protein